MKKLLVLLLAPVVLVGCSSVSNLTPTKAYRNAAGWYPVEAKFATKRTAVLDETIKPAVVVGEKSYPLSRVPLVKDRWEGFVPVPPSQNSIHYHFRFDYSVNRIPQAVPDSFTSSEFGLDVVEKSATK